MGQLKVTEHWSFPVWWQKGLYQSATEEFSSQSGLFSRSAMNNRTDLQSVEAENNAAPIPWKRSSSHIKGVATKCYVAGKVMIVCSNRVCVGVFLNGKWWLCLLKRQSHKWFHPVVVTFLSNKTTKRFRLTIFTHVSGEWRQRMGGPVMKHW